MSAKYKSPSFLLPNELNTSANTANDTGINSLYSIDQNSATRDEKLNIGGLNLGTTNTISMWLKFRVTGSDTILGCPSSSALSTSLCFLSSTALRFQIGTNNNADFDPSPGGQPLFPIDEWKHMVVTKTGTTLKLFIDGVYKEEVSIGNGNINTVVDHIGNRSGVASGQSAAMRGQIDEVSFYTSALTYGDVSIGQSVSSDSEIAKLYDSVGSSVVPSNLMATSLSPVAYYPLGEQAQNSSYPSATGNEWQFPNGVLQDYVMDFDGSNTEYIDTNFTGLNNTSAVTISAWMNIPVLTNLYALGNLQIDNGTYKGIGFNPATSSAFVYINNNTSNVAYFTFNPSSYYSAGNWFNIVFVFDGSKGGTNRLKVYIDKNLVTGTWTGTPLNVLETSTSNFLIGNDGQLAAPYFTGQISNVAIWNTAITDSAQIANIYNNGSPQTSYTVTPQNWWKLNADSVYTPSAPNYTTALDFVSSESDYISFATGSTIARTQSLTLSAWVNNRNGTIMGNRSSSNYGVSLYFYGNSLIFQLGNGLNWSFNNSGVANVYNYINNGEWSHIAATWDGTTSKVYINNIERNSWTPSDTLTISGWNDFGISKRAGANSGYVNGQISNCAVWDKALSSSQVSTLFNFGTPETAISFSPTAWWKLDDQTAITDSSGNGHTGTNNGATNSPGGVAYVPSWKIPSELPIPTVNYTSALSFDGSDYISVGSNNLGTSLTISAWVNLSSYGDIVLGGSNAAGSPNSYVFYISSSTQITAANFDGNYSTYTLVGPIDLNKWYHLAFVRDGAAGELFINGQSVGQKSGFGSSDFYLNYLGGQTPTGYNFEGSISNVAVFNSDLSAPQVATLFNSGQPEAAISLSPVSWWKLDTGGSTITDYTGSNNGTNNGATKVDSDVYTGVIPVNGVSTTLPSTALQQSDLQFDSPYSNYSLSFDGTGDYIDCTDNDMFSFGNGTTDSPFSVSFWAKLNSVSGTQPFLSKDTANPNREWAISIFSDSSNGVRIFLKNQGGNSQQSIDSSTALTTGVWYQITTTYDGRGGSDAADGLNIYINGILDTPTNISKGTYTAMSNTTAPVYIGKYSSSEINGKIDETAIFNTALTEAQVLEIYNNGKPGNLDNFSGTAPISWWRLGENAYFNTGTTPGPEFTVPNSIAGAPNGVGSGTVTTMLSADAPGTYANGIGDGLAITDRVGDAPLSVANSQSYNMIPDDKVPYVPGYVGAQINNVYSMTFDGVDDYVETDHVQGTNTSFTFSSWIKIDNTSGRKLIIGDGDSGGATASMRFGLEVNGNNLKMFLGNGSTSNTFQDTTNLNVNTWHHICVTISGTSIKVYIGGVKKDSFTLSFSFGTAGDRGYTIGAAGDYRASVLFEGQIDEVALFDEALTADQIKFDLYEPTALVGGVEKTADIENNTNLPTPVAWYRMGD